MCAAIRCCGGYEDRKYHFGGGSQARNWWLPRGIIFICGLNSIYLPIVVDFSGL